MSDITPQRLEELLAGDPPRTDAERDVLHMAAALRGAAPAAPDRLRERVMGTARTAPTRGGRLRLPSMSAPWMGPAVAGLAAVVLGAAVFLPGIGGGDGRDPVMTTAPQLADGGRSAGGNAPAPEATLAPSPDATQAPATPGPTEVAPPAQAAPSAMTVAASAVVVGPSDGWPASALEAVADPLEASGGVVTGATTGTALDGREDLTVEALVPAGREAEAVDAITAALPADTGWQPSGEARTALERGADGDTGGDDATPKDLAGSGAVPVTVVVVRDGTP